MGVFIKILSEKSKGKIKRIDGKVDRKEKELAYPLEEASSPQLLGTTARCWSMEYLSPPENLPVVPEPVEIEPEEDAHFRDQESGDTLNQTQSGGISPSVSSVPAPRSLQSKNRDMHEPKKRHVAASDRLLDPMAVAERLAVSTSTVYRLAARGRIAFYQLPGGVRFKATDVDAYLESHRKEVKTTRPYERPQDQW